ncbi:MAG: hypothetical protein ABIG66_04320 [Candidatus Kerfeldbacteria bacterium]
MKEAQQYRCRDCDNISWQPEICHGVPMEALCYCGSGEFLSDCHGEEGSEAARAAGQFEPKQPA